MTAIDTLPPSLGYVCSWKLLQFWTTSKYLRLKLREDTPGDLFFAEVKQYISRRHPKHNAVNVQRARIGHEVNLPL